MRCVLFDLQKSESHEKLNVSVVYSAIIQPAMLTESIFVLSVLHP